MWRWPRSSRPSVADDLRAHRPRPKCHVVKVQAMFACALRREQQTSHNCHHAGYSDYGATLVRGVVEKGIYPAL